MTLTVVGWIDVFTRQSHRDIILDSLRYCKANKSLHVHAYVIMSNHIHLIVSVSGKETLSEVIGAFKSYTAKAIIKAIEKEPESRKEWLLRLFKFYAGKNSKKSKQQTHQFWRTDNHPIALYSKKVVVQKLDYIHLNPLRAGLVEKPQDYLYSSASNYLEERKGLFDVDLLEVFFEPKV